MSSSDRLLKDKILAHEGSERFAYKDSEGHLTIGVGRCIDKEEGNGLSMDEQLYLLDNDIAKCRAELYRCNFYRDEKNVVRQDALVELCFNMGIAKLMRFIKMISALESKNYQEASKELANSEWAKEVSLERVMDLQYRIENGSYQ